MIQKYFARFLAGSFVAAGLLAAAEPTQKTFATPDEAAQELLSAAEAGNRTALVEMFGPGSLEIISTGDPAQDQKIRETFLSDAKASMKTEKDPMNANKAYIYIGTDEHPFAVPLVTTSDGQWRFDMAEGKREILARRIGANELDAIKACEAYVAAQQDHASRTRGYAARLIGSPGKDDGVFHPRPGSTATKTGDPAKPHNGYYFRSLRVQNPHSFAMIAWPAKYASTGIQTFIVNQDGVVYEKDLGPGTAQAVRSITRFNPDQSWHALR